MALSMTSSVNTTNPIPEQRDSGFEKIFKNRLLSNMRIKHERRAVCHLEVIHAPLLPPCDYEIETDFWGLRRAVMQEAAILGLPSLPKFTACRKTPFVYQVWLSNA